MTQGKSACKHNLVDVAKWRLLWNDLGAVMGRVHVN